MSLQILDARQNRLVTVLCELIIPQTRTPGARAAKVNEYIDLMLSQAGRPVQQTFEEGLVWIDRKSKLLFGSLFVDLDQEQQVDLLEHISSGAARDADEQIGVEFFKSIKTLTIRGYYTSRIGICDELQYQGNAALPEFPGCVHREHLNSEHS